MQLDAKVITISPNKTERSRIKDNIRKVIIRLTRGDL